MGFSHVTVDQFQRFHAKGIFKDVRAVCELGSQEISCEGKEAMLAALIEVFGAPALSDRQLYDLVNMGSARELYAHLGFAYHCIDPDEKFGALPLDLNYDQVPPDHRARYELVTNLGTSEHVANQINCFEVVHDLTAVGGYMYHEVPFTGYVNHGLLSYTPKMFWMLCRSNFYQYVDMFIYADRRRSYLHPDITGRGMSTCNLGPEDFAHQDSVLCCLLRKAVDMPFVAPYDSTRAPEDEVVPSRYWTLTSKDAQQRAQEGRFPSEVLLEQTRKSLGPPLFASSGWEIQRELFRRYRRKLLGWMRRS